MDAVHPDELLLGLDALQAETLDQCMAVDVDCALPQITDILNQYDSAGELVRHAIDFGYVWAEQGQGEPHWLEKWMCVMELEDCHRLDLALDLAQNLHCYEYIPRGVDLAQYGMDLARKEGVLGQDPLLNQASALILGNSGQGKTYLRSRINPEKGKLFQQFSLWTCFPKIWQTPPG